MPMPMPDALALYRKNKERAVSLGIDEETFSVGFSELVARKEISEDEKAKVLNDPHYFFKYNDGLLISWTPAINHIFQETGNHNIARMLLVMGADPHCCNIFKYEGEPSEETDNFFRYLDREESSSDYDGQSSEEENIVSLRAVAEEAVKFIEAAKSGSAVSTVFRQENGEVPKPIKVQKLENNHCCCTIM